MSTIKLIPRFPQCLNAADIVTDPPPEQVAHTPSIGYRIINGKWWRIVDGVPERELTEAEALDVQYGIWP